MVGDGALPVLHQLEFVFKESNVEICVMDDKLALGDKFQEFFGDVGKPRLAFEIGQADSVDAFGAFVDGSFRVDEAVILAAGESAVDHLDATDFDDAMTLRGGKPGGFCVEDDLSHGQHFSLYSLMR